MGGLLFNTERLQASQYFELVDELYPKLESFAKGVCIVNAYEQKEDFGDADFLYTLPNKNVREFLTQDMGIDESDIHRNGDVTSFKYKDFQVDLIKIAPEHWDSAPFFYDYNDFGNFIGKLYNTYGGSALGGRQGAMDGKLRFKFGPEGLTARFYRKSKKQVHTISKNINDIVKFLGLPNYRAFINETELFDYIIQSKYFTKSIFQPENQNHTNRQRNKKRKGYNSFLEYIKTVDNDNEVIFNEDLNYYINYVDLFFGTKISVKYAEFLRECILEEELKSLMNVSKIRDEFNIDGPELGKLVQHLREELSSINPVYSDGSFDVVIKPRVENYLLLK